jgi:tetratricopeptide (TPR) repeat protein
MPLAFPLFALAVLLTLQGGAPAQTAPQPDRKTAERKASEAARLVAAGEIEKALAAAREAVAADPENPQGHYVLGLVHEAAGELDEAETEYKKMGIGAPEPLLQLSLARLYLRQGKISEAEVQARRAVEKNKWVPQPHLALGAVLMRKKDYPAAIAAFQEAVNADPRDATARLSLGDAYRHAGRVDDALSQYSQAEALAPNDPAPYVGRAQTWEQMGRPAEAIAAYEKSLQVRPTVGAQYSLARLYLDAGDPRVQNPQRALELATAADEATGHRNPAIMETLENAKKRVQK